MTTRLQTFTFKLTVAHVWNKLSSFNTHEQCFQVCKGGGGGKYASRYINLKEKLGFPKRYCKSLTVETSLLSVALS